MAQQFGKFLLLKKLAAGGMAEIHLANQRGMEGFEKLVVIKMILPHLATNQEFVQMFLDEARLAARLSHPNIVQIFDLGRAASTYFIAMEYIQGGNLREISKACRKRGKAIPLEHTVKIISQACEGLHYAHTKTDMSGTPLNIVHRDISPQNLLVSFEGIVKVVDFGIAKAATQYQETRSGVLKGKYAYMSPEQCTGGKVDARSDIFALGIVLWELATGTRLFKQPSELMILKEITEGRVTPPREINQQIPAELEAIILKALERDVGNRFQDALQMHLALEEFLKDQVMLSSSVHLAAFMRELFPDKLDQLRKLADAQTVGEGLESMLFDDLDSYPAASSTPSHPSRVGSQPLVPKSTTGVSRVAARPGTGTPQPVPPGTYPPPSSGMYPVPPGSYPPPGTGIYAAPEPRGNKLLIAVLALLFVVLGGLGFLAYHQFFSDKDGSGPTDQPDAGMVVARPTAGRISVVSIPEGATVKVNGNERCHAPCEVGELTLGEAYSLEVSKQGHRPWTTQFKLEDPTEVRRFSARLDAISIGRGWVEVITDPPGASLKLDGKPVDGKTPLTISQVLADREHTVVASHPGYQDWTKSFRLLANERLQLKGLLEQESATPPSSDRPAVYSLRSRPGGAAFRLDGRPVGASIRLDPGRSYELSAELSGYSTWSDKLKPRAGERRTITARLTRSGAVSPPPTGDTKAKLFLDSKPWATVFIDGEKVGTTPVADLTIAAGRHEVRLVNSEINASKTITIRAQPGETVREKVEFAKGLLQVRAKPWAHVYIAGKQIGTTPFAPKELFEGTYKVKLENPTLGTSKVQTVTIKNGQTATIEVDFLE